MPSLSAVIPVFCEAESLPALHAELVEVARDQGHELEIIFVDDGSTDGSWPVIERLAAEDARVRGIRFRRNFGKAAALSAGFKEARGEFVFTLDADLQDDPREIPRFLAAMTDELDVISGWKKVRHDPWHKVLPSRVFNWLVGWLTGVRLHDHNCGFKCYRREVLSEVRIYGELHRFIPVLAHQEGYRVAELPVRHRPRAHGRSRYGPERYLRGFFDLLTVSFMGRYRHRPLHLFGGLGLLLGLIGFGILAYLTALKVAGEAIGHRPLLTLGVLLLVVGIQLFSLGLVSELITAQHEQRRRERERDDLHVDEILS